MAVIIHFFSRLELFYNAIFLQRHLFQFRLNPAVGGSEAQSKHMKDAIKTVCRQQTTLLFIFFLKNATHLFIFKKYEQ